MLKTATTAWLWELVRDLSYYLPEHRREFRRHILDYLGQGVRVMLPNKRGLDVAVESLLETDTFLSKELFLGFKLEEARTDKPKPRADIEKLVRTTPLVTVEHSVALSPGDERIGERVLNFTFSSLAPVDDNVKRFESFIVETYVPPEQFKAREREFWDRLISAGSRPRDGRELG